MATFNGIHERTIPSIGDSDHQIQAVEQDTRLSVAFATSIAVAKRLTWAETPGLHDGLSPAESDRIATALTKDLNRHVPARQFENAIYLGTTYLVDTDNLHDHLFPELYLVCPKLSHDISKDPSFLRAWHKDIVGPAFTRSWQDSGLAEIKHSDGRRMVQHILDLPGRYNEDLPHLPSVEGIVNYVLAGRMIPIEAFWPAWSDKWQSGLEGMYSDERARNYNSAWRSITGMLKDYPGLEELQNPKLMVVFRSTATSNTTPGPKALHSEIGKQMDEFLDSRFIEPGTLRILVDTVTTTATE